MNETNEPTPTATASARDHGIKSWLVAASLVNLAFLNSWFSVLFDEDRGYFNRLPVNRVTLFALLFNFVLFTVITWLIIQLRRRLQRGVIVFCIDALAMLPLLLVINFVRTAGFEVTDYSVYLFLKRPYVTVGCVVLLGLFFWKHRWFSQLAAVLAGILSPLALLTVGKIVLALLGVAHFKEVTAGPALPPPGPVTAGQPRVLWIIFDETDQRLLFDERMEGYDYPAFDRLRAGAIYSTRAYTPSDGTLYSLPGLISGHRVLHASITNSADLQLELDDVNQTVTWKSLPSVFSDARAMGVNTAVLGWYHPYARVLGTNVNYCQWFAFPLFEPVRSRTFWRAVERQLSCFVWTVHVRSDYVYLLKECRTSAVALATNATYGLTFMHLPPPHLPGVYLPKVNQFKVLGMSKTRGYFNNLTLADEWLGEIRAAMEQAGLWDKTWVIVSADHSWRDSKLYDQVRDLRVPYLVKPAGMPDGGAITFTNQFNTVVTRGFIDAVLSGELKNAENATNWLQAHESLVTPTSSSSKHDR